MRPASTLSVLIALLIPLTAPAVHAADGDFDSTFRSGGTFVHAVASGGGRAAAVAPDGRLLIGYTEILSGTDRDLRVLPVLDQGVAVPCPSFHPDLGGTDEDVLTTIAVEGNLVYVGGTAAGPGNDPDRRLALAAYDLSTCTMGGPPGADGFTYDLGINAWSAEFVLQPSGGTRWAVLRTTSAPSALVGTVGLSTTGQLDGSFLPGAEDFAEAFGAEGFTPAAITRAPDGKLVVVGNVEYTNGDRDVGVMRIKVDGELDTTFSLDGLASFSYGIVDGGQDGARAVAVLPDGRIVVAGSVGVSVLADAAVAILTPTGGFYNPFGVVGRKTFRFTDEPRWDRIEAVALQGDHKLVVVGSTSGSLLSNNGDLAIARLSPQGDDPLDPTFADGGVKIVDLGGDDAAYAVTLGQRNRVTAVGASSSGGSTSVVAVRLENPTIFVDGFDADGVDAWPLP